MIKFIFLSLTFFLTSTLNATDVQMKTEENSTKQTLKPFQIVTVNQHTITSNIFSKRKANALQYKFKKNEQKSMIEQLIRDEIAVQYALNYSKLEDNISNEKERLAFGLNLIQTIALKELAKNISDKNASTYYHNNKKRFWNRKKFSVSHIVVDSKDKAQKVIEKLKGSSDINSTFKKLNAIYLGKIEADSMGNTFKNALEKLKVNSFTETPVHTSFGYHIILLHHTTPAKQISFEEVKESIKMGLAQGKRTQWFTKTLLPLKKSAKIKYLLKFNEKK